MPNKSKSKEKYFTIKKPDIFKKHSGFIILLIFVTSWISLIVFIPPAEIISIIGIEKSYLIIFITAFIGVSGFASVPFYATFVTFTSSGELSLFLLILIAAPARAFGDNVFFF